ncbi:MAG: hypothetical protein HUJ26_12570 [Planctomycetaceae bacterium]|nr:hypothetical protein [Planctomycetaceae bacterium]
MTDDGEKLNAKVGSQQHGIEQRLTRGESVSTANQVVSEFHSGTNGVSHNEGRPGWCRQLSLGGNRIKP